MPEPDPSDASGWLDSPVRRAVELAIVVPLVALAAPFMAVVAVAVRRVLGRPVLFRQVRSGRHGRPVGVVKFRTMTEETDAEGQLLPDAERLVGLGRLLRSTSLDELPQLWSVVTGEMSLIGPRPLPAAYDDRYSPAQARRLEARPGLTGWAQVHGRNAVGWTERFDLDVWYVDHASWRFDLSVLVRTVSIVVQRKGVTAVGHDTMPGFDG